MPVSRELIRSQSSALWIASQRLQSPRQRWMALASTEQRNHSEGSFKKFDSKRPGEGTRHLAASPWLGLSGWPSGRGRVRGYLQVGRGPLGLHICQSH